MLRFFAKTGFLANPSLRPPGAARRCQQAYLRKIEMFCVSETLLIVLKHACWQLRAAPGDLKGGLAKKCGFSEKPTEFFAARHLTHKKEWPC
jgi:hypothetical protein